MARKGRVRKVIAARYTGKEATIHDKPGQLRSYQADDYLQTAHEPLTLSNYAVGAGKTISGKAKAEFWRRKGYRIVVAVPQDLIAPGFRRADRMRLPKGHGVMEWPELPDEKLTVAELVKWANGREPGIKVVTHQLAVLAHKAGAQWRKVCMVIDEAHRAAHDETDVDGAAQRDKRTNRLGELIGYFARKKLPLHLLTATFFREDSLDIVPPEFRERLKVYEVPLEKVLGNRTLIFSYLVGDIDDCLELALKGKRPTIVWIPSAGSRLSRTLGGKQAALSLVTSKARGKVCDLVTSAGRDERKAANFAELERGKGPDVTVCLNLGFEGYDDPRLSRGVLIGARQSVRATAQACGRLTRLAPDKDELEFITILPTRNEVTAEEVNRHLQGVLTSFVVKWHMLPSTLPPKVSKKLREPDKAVEEMQQVIRDAFTGGACGVKAGLKARYGEDAEELAGFLAGELGEALEHDDDDAPAIPRAKKRTRIMLEGAPELGIAAQRLADGVTTFCAKMSADGVGKLREHFTQSVRRGAPTDASSLMKAISMVKLGARHVDAANGCGVSYGVLSNTLGKLGLRRAITKNTPALTEKIELMLSNGATQTETSSTLGVGWDRVATVARRLEKSGVSINRTPAGGPRRSLEYDKTKRVADAISSNPTMSDRGIARICGVGCSKTVRRIRAEVEARKTKAAS